MAEMAKQLQSSWGEMERSPAERFLVGLAGIVAIVFGVLSFGLGLLDVRFAGALAALAGTSGSVLGFLLTMLFGALLLYAYGRMAQEPTEGTTLAVAFSVVLLAFGGLVGAVSGILGIVGATVGILRHVRWTA